MVEVVNATQEARRLVSALLPKSATVDSDCACGGGVELRLRPGRRVRGGRADVKSRPKVMSAVAGIGKCPLRTWKAQTALIRLAGPTESGFAHRLRSRPEGDARCALGTRRSPGQERRTAATTDAQLSAVSGRVRTHQRAPGRRARHRSLVLQARTRGTRGRSRQDRVSARLRRTSPAGKRPGVRTATPPPKAERSFAVREAADDV